MKKVMHTISTFLLFLSLSVCAKGVELKGQYDVPVSDDELLNFSKFPLSGIELEEDRFKYLLPEDLAETYGEKLTFKKVSTVNGVTEFESEFGIAQCKFMDQPITRCDIDYNKKLVDILMSTKEQVRQRLIEQGIEGEALAKRMMVVDGFSGDPIGIRFIFNPTY